MVGYSGMVADDAVIAWRPVSKPPVLLVHGDADPMIPIQAFQRAKATLEGAGFPSPRMSRRASSTASTPPACTSRAGFWRGR